VPPRQSLKPPTPIVDDGLNLYFLVVNLIPELQIYVEVREVRSRELSLFELLPHLCK
jgi:hypothetical protein